MKKLLSLLSVLTISGTAVPTTIAASPYQKEKHNTENLIRNKRNIEINNFNINYIEKLYDQDLKKDLLRIWISKKMWKNIDSFQNFSSNEEFKNYLVLTFNQFLKTDISEVNKENQLKLVYNEDIKTIAKIIHEKFFEIKDFQIQNNNSALIVTTTIDGQWFKNTSVLSQYNNNNEVNPGAGVNSGATLQVDYRFLAHDKITIYLRGTEVKKYFNNFSKLTWIDFTKWLDYFIDNMEKVDHTGSGGEIENSDINIAKKMMRQYVFKLSDTCFDKKSNNILSCNSFKIQTNRVYEDPIITKNYF